MAAVKFAYFFLFLVFLKSMQLAIVPVSGCDTSNTCSRYDISKTDKICGTVPPDEETCDAVSPLDQPPGVLDPETQCPVYRNQTSYRVRHRFVPSSVELKYKPTRSTDSVVNFPKVLEKVKSNRSSTWSVRLSNSARSGTLHKCFHDDDDDDDDKEFKLGSRPFQTNSLYLSQTGSRNVLRRRDPSLRYIDPNYRDPSFAMIYKADFDKRKESIRNVAEACTSTSQKFPEYNEVHSPCFPPTDASTGSDSSEEEKTDKSGKAFLNECIIPDLLPERITELTGIRKLFGPEEENAAPLPSDTGEKDNTDQKSDNCIANCQLHEPSIEALNPTLLGEDIIKLFYLNMKNDKTFFQKVLEKVLLTSEFVENVIKEIKLDIRRVASIVKSRSSLNIRTSDESLLLNSKENLTPDELFDKCYHCIEKMGLKQKYLERKQLLSSLDTSGDIRKMSIDSDEEVSD